MEAEKHQQQKFSDEKLWYSIEWKEVGVELSHTEKALWAHSTVQEAN